MQFAKADEQTKVRRKRAGSWLKELRARAGLSQIELAERRGLKFRPKAWKPGHARWGAEPSMFAREQMSNVVQFPRPAEPDGQGWQSSELQQVMQTCAASIAAGEASGWEIGATDLGDPQVYLGRPIAGTTAFCAFRESAAAT
jgi:transcriptional regulator with XRE-family HTH domain